MLLRRHYRKNVTKLSNVSGSVEKKENKLEDLTVLELKNIAKESEIEGYYKMNKSELLENLGK